MASKNLDRGLDDIIAEGRSDGSRNQRPRRQERQVQPRDGVRKSYRSEPRDIESDWVHDRFEEHNSRRGPATRLRRDSAGPDTRDKRGAKLRVENIHYDLTEEDLDELFKRIGTVVRLQLRYDRAGRSEGVAYVTYESKQDVDEAVRQFDGANANGQPIKLVALPSGPSRNPFDSAVMPSRPLAERVSRPNGRSRSLSPQRKYDMDDAARRGIDRYIPDGPNRSKSPMPRRRGGGGGGGGDRGGRRPGARREGGGRDQDGGRPGRENPRQKKTQGELDAEMEDYFGGGGAPPAASEPSNGAVAPVPSDDIDMIE